MSFLIVSLVIFGALVAIFSVTGEKADGKTATVEMCLDSEQTMAVTSFRKDFVDLNDLVALVKTEKLTGGSLTALQTFINTYSVDGFKRFLSSERKVGVVEKEAAVLVCLIADVPYSFLWANLFMSELEARNYMNAVGA